MNDINLFSKNEKELETLKRKQKKKIQIYRQNLGMEFSIEKSAMQIIRSRKRQQKDQQSNNNKETEIGRKTTLLIFHVVIFILTSVNDTSSLRAR